MGNYVHDPRDAENVDIDAINNGFHYGLTSVFATAVPLPSDEAERSALVADTLAAIEVEGVELRGTYDIAGFRADADLLVWWLSDDPAAIQKAYRALLASPLGDYLDPIWSVMGQHTPAEFNRGHVPACFAGVAPRDWITVYPFVRSYDWYLLPAEERSRIMSEHGRNGFSQYPDVKGSTLSSFGMSDYEWILAFEADSLDRLEGVLHAQRYTEARLHVRVDTPFFTGRRVPLAEWASVQPLA
ncbi:hydrogen peroxide-dependent heme synthase [Schaalia hyovaginalis]|uniref:Coproheme decarboxylase n=1 Tax=Schaalia hyovaginalis TaxID=29316 RepID=A0A923E432_9ACTO|nr:hydrogen peroxide-dependent heme synthase [Schaalia hyovaginalis]MBB6335696.1 chlorite dismutase [Schaalia hyovaginalis]MCI6556271.1 chlorite dismutase family protein [Schaalia hyovaginalis]MCI7671699.1 chlorite dismutase family protein [Schaalia hyovaginalis]MDD7554958.1 chlorite dismutase family protein [Schaalia hyovaginalis]MDY2669172.1 hydrogen peroxide-dependent heme synthase [Schaalia hyovaginalis]